MTDDSPTSPGSTRSSDPDSAPPNPALDVDLAAELGPPAPNRRRRLVIAVVAGMALLVLLVCAAFGAAAAGISRLVRESDREQDARIRVEVACLALEKRLNRLTPPGATGSPGERAAAIRDENTAVQPFLAEIETVRGWQPEDGDDEDGPADRGGWTDRWRELVAARTSYADALDRQVTHGEPAFFIAPADADGRPVLQRLERGAVACAGAARRLAAPDL